MNKQQVKFLNMKKLNSKIFNASYNQIIHFMVSYLLIIILVLLWHIFWIHKFHFLCDKHIVIISKIHNESIFLKNSFTIFNKILTKVYYNMDNEKIENFNVWYDFTFL